MPANPGNRFLLKGLNSSAEILVDRWGVPHIYASSADDAFFAQGFNAARDRLWQIDLWRRRGLGLLSEVFGAAYLDRDRAARLFLYRGDMHGEWLAYGSDTKRVTTRFIEGVNEYVRLARKDRSYLPVEFRELGYLPAVWSPEDVARIRSHGLFYNLSQEVARARVLRDYGREVEDLRRQREPAHELRVPDGLDLSLIPDDVLHVYELATTPPVLAGTAADTGDAVTGKPPEGSNNWVLAAGRTGTGRPMLANDPHRALSVPSLRYLAHLVAPDFNVIGGGEPALPGISIGHNGRIAFGLTIFAIDQEDLYVYRTDPADPREYWYQDRWEPMRIVEEAVPVRDGQPVAVELRFTRHGPVIYEDPERHTAFAARVAWLEPGMAPYLGSMDYMRAGDWDQFLAAMNRWGAPPENQVYADASGTIGWKTGGLTPIRPNWDGLLPVPGDGRYEWAGFYDMDQLPGSVNPPAAWLATANEMNLPPGFPPDQTITFDWYAPYRRHRIEEVLGNDRPLSLADSVALQNDYVSIPARRIVQRLDGLNPDSPKAADALRLLRGWDGNLSADSAAAALFEVWYRRHLRPALLRQALERLAPPGKVSAALQAVLPVEDLLTDARVDLSLLEQPGTRLGPDPASVISGVMLSSLADAVGDLEQLLGPDKSQWSWGRLHVSRLTHPASALVSAPLREKMTVGPVPRGGSGDTVGNTAYTPNFVQSAGSTFRIVIDVGNWDGSLAMNSPGQSGDPDSSHYADLFGSWASGEAFPLLYTRERVEDAVERRIILEPPWTCSRSSSSPGTAA
ncbi:MAG: penicillin acylase family protein [Streptosporangiaceae bacterium]|nr:penicillin acylase family protein [Streptosporangiaceae bacterium]